MCFVYDDYEWQPEVVDHTTGILTAQTLCMECGKLMLDGEFAHEVHMEQYETCPICQENEDNEISGVEAMHVCVIGETYDYVRCVDCDRLIECVAIVEAREGCPPGSRKPAYEDLRAAAFQESESRYEYALEAVDRYPNLWHHPFIVEMLK